MPQTDNIPAFQWLGYQPYIPMWQRLKMAAAVTAGGGKETIYCCEHEAVYTTGKRAVDNRISPELPAPMIRTDRGGETTFHGPGQLMFYPVIHIKKRHVSPRDYVYLLEQSVIDLLAEFPIDASRRCALPGVWTHDGKIAAIGLRIMDGVAYHGMALNVDVAANWFEVINPCGTGKSSVSISRYVDAPPELKALASKWHSHFIQLLQQN